MTDFTPTRPTRWQTFWARPVTGLFWSVGMLLLTASYVFSLPPVVVWVGVVFTLVIVVRPLGSEPDPLLGRRFVKWWQLLFLPLMVLFFVSIFYPPHSPFQTTAQVLVGGWALIDLVWRLADLRTRRRSER